MGFGRSSRAPNFRLWSPVTLLVGNRGGILCAWSVMGPLPIVSRLPCSLMAWNLSGSLTHLTQWFLRRAPMCSAHRAGCLGPYNTSLGTWVRKCMALLWCTLSAMLPHLTVVPEFVGASSLQRTCEACGPRDLAPMMRVTLVTIPLPLLSSCYDPASMLCMCSAGRSTIYVGFTVGVGLSP